VVKTESTELGVSSADANRANADIRGKLGHSRLAAELIPKKEREAKLNFAGIGLKIIVFRTLKQEGHHALENQ
jgi:hypothetical protein